MRHRLLAGCKSEIGLVEARVRAQRRRFAFEFHGAVADDIGPVRDAITNGKDGILLDFFDIDALSNALIAACREPKKYAAMRKAARQTILKRYDRATICEPKWLELVQPMLGTV